MKLDINKITSCGSDWETNRYTFLLTLKSWQDELWKNKLYPSIEYTCQINTRLGEILNENIESKFWLEKEVRGTFIEDRLVVLEKAHQIGLQLDRLIDFVKWGIEENRHLTYEAEVLKDFVCENLKIYPCCDVSKFRGKGYILIPDNRIKVYKIYLYELSLSWSVDEPVEYLEMELLRTIPISMYENNPVELLNTFVEHSQKIYDPMIYLCETELDFPFKETILPVARLKLLESVNGITSNI